MKDAIVAALHPVWWAVFFRLQRLAMAAVFTAARWEFWRTAALVHRLTLPRRDPNQSAFVSAAFALILWKGCGGPADDVDLSALCQAVPMHMVLEKDHHYFTAVPMEANAMFVCYALAFEFRPYLEYCAVLAVHEG
jgi:hypothetical protein